MTKLLGGADLQGARGTNFADPSSAADAATKQYVDNLVSGLAWKRAVRAATTTNGALGTAYANGQVIDGVTLVTGDRVLLKNQTSQTENGIYIVAASGAPTRATDADTTAELNNATVAVSEGTTNGGTSYTQTTKNVVIGTNSIVFALYAAGLIYTAADDTITVSGSTLAVKIKASSGILHDGTNGLAIDPAYAGLTKRYSADCVATTNPQTFNHALASSDILVSVRLKGTGEIVIPYQVIITDANNISVDFGGAPTSAQYRVTVVG